MWWDYYKTCCLYDPTIITNSFEWFLIYVYLQRCCDLDAICIIDIPLNIIKIIAINNNQQLLTVLVLCASANMTQ